LTVITGGITRVVVIKKHTGREI